MFTRGIGFWPIPISIQFHVVDFENVSMWDVWQLQNVLDNSWVSPEAYSIQVEGMADDAEADDVEDMPRLFNQHNQFDLWIVSQVNKLDQIGGICWLWYFFQSFSDIAWWSGVIKSNRALLAFHAALDDTLEEWLPGLSLEGFLWQDDAQEESKADDFLNFMSSWSKSRHQNELTQKISKTM